MIKIHGFSHVAVRISDPERANKFYQNVLGLKPIPRPAFPFAGGWYGIGDQQIHLISAEKREGGINPQGPHFAFEVEDLEETRRTLKEMGIEFVEAPWSKSGHQLWILDPDGNTIELRARR